MPLAPRKIGSVSLPPIGLGCMNLSHAYGVPPPKEQAATVLLHAVERGVVHFDTAALYGFGANEALIGEVLAPHRDRIYLASKCAMTGVDGKRVIDGRPETIRRTCDEALTRLRTDFIDLYYLHRWDKQVPIEESMGAMRELLLAGKIRAIGLCEVSADTLRKAQRVHPIAAVQSEHSLWSRNPEIAVLDACEELDVAFVAFSPLARGFLPGGVPPIDAFAPGDIRRSMPRFHEPHWSHNSALLPRYYALARDAGCTPAQLALAWLLQKHPRIHVIPGTTQLSHLEDDLAAADVVLPASVIAAAEALINQTTVSGGRYPAGTQAEIDTEEFH